MNLRKKLFICGLTLLIVLYLLLYWNINDLKRGSYPYQLYRQDGMANLAFPPDSLDPKSAFYGMHYKNTYGLLRNTLENSTDAHGKKFWKNYDWKIYFPTLFSSLNRLKNPNLDHDGTSITAAVTFKNFKDKKVGDTFIKKFQTVDRAGRLKTYGGDYFRARLIIQTSSRSAPDGIACFITDHENGTYSLKAPLLYPAKWILDLKLVLPVEGIAKIIEETTLKKVWGQTYIAKYPSGQTSVCNLDLSVYESFKDQPTCDHSNPRNDEPWFCLKPKNEPCSRITDLTYLGPRKNKEVNFVNICNTFGCHKNMAENIVITIPSGLAVVQPNMPSCKTLFSTHSDSEWSSGYFINNHWRSLQCSSNISTLGSLNTCLRDKVIYFFGDSTIRQFFYAVVWKLWLGVYGPDNSKIWQQPRIAYKSFPWYRNITVYYRAHGPPLQNPGPPSSRPYISDSVDGIEVGGKGLFVILNIGVHLINYEPSFYIHRLKGIRKSIIKHLEIFPETKFIIRGLNVVELPFEWLIRRYEVILRETFKDMKNVLFLNFWDLTTVRPLDDYYPPTNMLNHEALLMFQYVCS